MPSKAPTQNDLQQEGCQLQQVGGQEIFICPEHVQIGGRTFGPKDSSDAPSQSSDPQRGSGDKEIDSMVDHQENK